MSEPRTSKMPRYARRIALGLALVIAGLLVLFVSFAPTVEVPKRPTPGNVAAAREVWQQMKAAQRSTGETRVRVDNKAMLGIASLASDATGYARFEAGIARGELNGRSSIALPAGLWINASASAAGEHDGFVAPRNPAAKTLGSGPR